VLIAWPNEAAGRNDFAISIPYLGSLIATMTLDSKEVGLTDFPVDQRPPVLIPFFAFRIMVGCGLLMLAISWGGLLLTLLDRLETLRWPLWAIFASFPLGFIATLTGWFTAEVGRQPWTVFGLLRTADAATPFLRSEQIAVSLAVFACVYALIFAAGITYIYRLLRAGVVPLPKHTPLYANSKRPMALPGGDSETDLLASKVPAE